MLEDYNNESFVYGNNLLQSIDHLITIFQCPSFILYDPATRHFNPKKIMAKEYFISRMMEALECTFAAVTVSAYYISKSPLFSVRISRRPQRHRRRLAQAPQPTETRPPVPSSLEERVRARKEEVTI